MLKDFAKDDQDLLDAMLEGVGEHASLLAEGNASSFQNKVHLAVNPEPQEKPAKDKAKGKSMEVAMGSIEAAKGKLSPQKAAWKPGFAKAFLRYVDVDCGPLDRVPAKAAKLSPKERATFWYYACKTSSSEHRAWRQYTGFVVRGRPSSASEDEDAEEELEGDEELLTTNRG